MTDKFLDSLSQCSAGFLELAGASGKTLKIGNANHPLRAGMHIHDSKTSDLVAARGDIGLGEAYMKLSLIHI